MRSFGKFTLAVALVAALLQAAPQAQSTQAASLYQQARALEATLRKELDSAAAAGTTGTLVTRMRTLARTYEDLWRIFPTSPYSDDALWYGATLSADAFWQTGDAADRAKALRLFQALTANFPTSSLVKKVSPQVTRLQSAKPNPAATAAASAVTHAPAAQTPPVQTPAAAPYSAPPSGPSTLTAIRREVLPDALRVTLELEREPEFLSERIDGPPRVFIDMQNTRASAALRDASLPFRDDVVRQIRVGRQLNGRTRVVLDLSGAGKYSVYTLYNPFRIVVDFDRKLPGAAAPAPQQPVVQAALQAAPPAPAAATDVAKTRAPQPGPATSPTAPRPPSTQPPAASSDPIKLRPTPPDTTVATGPAVVTTTGHAPVATPSQASQTSKPRQAPTEPAADKPKPAIAKGPEPGDSFTRPSALPPLPGTNQQASSSPSAPPVPPAANSGGSFSLSRQLGLGIARIVIDPGHGGHDPGAQAKGLSEAELTLDIALRLEKLFTTQSGVEVVLTRRGDTFVPLQERTAIANRAGADLFLSIHGNANDDTSLRGIETYFLNLSPDSDAARIVARENASSSKTMHDFEDIVKAIALNDKIDESRDFATLVQSSLYEKLRTANRETRNLGVKQAPFMVLIGATMPSILAEISFITNKQDAALLKTDKYRQQIAEALYQGVMRYQQALKKVPAIAMSN